MNPNLIIDFDSTFVTVEALDELARICLKENLKKDKILNEIMKITKLGMEGKIDFSVSLRKRLVLFKPTKTEIEKLISMLKKNISPSVKRNKEFFRKYKKNIYIVSGGFIEYIFPIVSEFGIEKNHVLANSFLFDKKGIYRGFDKNNMLTKKDGKSKAIKTLNLNSDTYIIGDGHTDYVIKQKGQAKKFYAFTENIERAKVTTKADKIIKNFDELLYLFDLPRSLSYPKSKMKILLLENINKLAVEAFTKEGYEVESIASSINEKELIEKIQGVSILGIRSKTKVTSEVLEKANRLLAIGAFCIGTDQIDLEATSRKGIAVFNAPYSNTRSVVELVMGEIIMLYRNVFDKSTKLHKGIWDKSAANAKEIRGKKLGIVGYGNIGSQLSVIAESLGMEVNFYDIAEKQALGRAHKCQSLKELLEISDVITVHVDGNKTNTNLIGEKEFKKMKQGVIFINASRGFIVDINALAQNLKSGKIISAAIDVFPNEPKSNDEKFHSPLQALPNVILTPHIAGSTEEAQRNIGDYVSRKLIQFINTGETALSVNFPQIQLPDHPKTHRLIHIHKNTPGVLSQINTILAENKINIEGQYLKTNEQIGYVITDVNKNYDKKIIDILKNVPGTIKLRILY